MSFIKLFLIFSVMISLSLEGPCAITTKVDEYTDCRDKQPFDSRNYVCCYLEANDGRLKKCVEVRKTDIEESEDFDKLENSIKNGSYEVWMWDNYTGFEEYKTGNVTIREIDSLRCNHSHYLYLGFLILLFTLFSYF